MPQMTQYGQPYHQQRAQQYGYQQDTNAELGRQPPTAGTRPKTYDMFQVLTQSPPQDQHKHQTYAPYAARPQQQPAPAHQSMQINTAQNWPLDPSDALQMQRKQAIAQTKIIESLVLNREIKQAVKQRIQQEMLRTSLIVQRFLRRIRRKKQAALDRRNYIFDATIYLVVNKHDIKLKPTSRVEIFGQFTEQAPWNIKVPCVFDKHFQCFKADIRIKRG